MDLNTEHTIVLTTDECMAFLAAAKTVMESYAEADRDSESHRVLISAVKKLGAGMGFPPKKAQQLSDFMDIGGDFSSLRK